jgi:hypothetical protein
MLPGLIEQKIHVRRQQRGNIDLLTRGITRQQPMISLTNPLSDVLLKLAVLRPMLDPRRPIHLPVRLLHAAAHPIHVIPENRRASSPQIESPDQLRKPRAPTELNRWKEFPETDPNACPHLHSFRLIPE